MAIQIRPANLPDDSDGIAAIDTGFETDSYYDVEAEAHAFRIVQRPMAGRTKTFFVYDLREAEREWDEAHVAIDGDRIVGFVATGWQFWNRRLVLWHIYVDRSARGQGLGHRLLQLVHDRAARQGALSIFLETSNLNVPGIAWYERQGFVLGGLDTTLYEGTAAREEKALYLMKRL